MTGQVQVMVCRKISSCVGFLRVIKCGWYKVPIELNRRSTIGHENSGIPSLITSLITAGPRLEVCMQGEANSVIHRPVTLKPSSAICLHGKASYITMETKIRRKIRSVSEMRPSKFSCTKTRLSTQRTQRRNARDHPMI